MAINKGKEIELLYREADSLRKDAHKKYKQVSSLEITSTKLSQDELIAKTRFLMRIAFDIEKYSMWIQGKYHMVTVDEIKAYRRLIELVRQALP